MTMKSPIASRNPSGHAVLDTCISDVAVLLPELLRSTERSTPQLRTLKGRSDNLGVPSPIEIPPCHRGSAMPLLEESLAYAERAGKHSMQILVRLIAAEDAEPGH